MFFNKFGTSYCFISDSRPLMRNIATGKLATDVFNSLKP